MCFGSCWLFKKGSKIKHIKFSFYSEYTKENPILLAVVVSTTQESAQGLSLEKDLNDTYLSVLIYKPIK